MTEKLADEKAAECGDLAFKYRPRARSLTSGFRPLSINFHNSPFTRITQRQHPLELAQPAPVVAEPANPGAAEGDPDE
jgi:hypothetical protein